jgi:hypothetical protein
MIIILNLKRQADEMKTRVSVVMESGTFHRIRNGNPTTGGTWRMGFPPSYE